MPTTYLQLLSGTATGDPVPAADLNKLTYALDRVAQGPYNLLGAGVFSGWNITSGASTVTSGAGLIGACWCKTTAGQAVSGLVAGSTNYVYAKTDIGSPASGTLDFVARATSAGVTNYDSVTAALYIGKAHYVAATGLHTIVTTNRDTWGIDHGSLLGLTDDDHPDYMRPVEVLLEGREAQVLGTSAATTSSYGTNARDTIVKLPNGSTTRGNWAFVCPADYSGTITVYTDWVSSGLAGNSRLLYLNRCRTHNETFDAALTSCAAAANVAISGANGYLRRTSFLWTANQPTPGDRCTIAIRRDGAHASDTMSGAARLASLRIKFATAR